MQHVERNEKTIEGVFNRKTLIASNDYWELWYVDGGGKVTPVLMGFNDRFTVGGREYRLATQGSKRAVRNNLFLLTGKFQICAHKKATADNPAPRLRVKKRPPQKAGPMVFKPSAIC